MKNQVQKPYIKRNNSITYAPINLVPNSSINSNSIRVITSSKILPNSRALKRVQSPTPLNRINVGNFRIGVNNQNGIGQINPFISYDGTKILGNANYMNRTFAQQNQIINLTKSQQLVNGGINNILVNQTTIKPVKTNINNQNQINMNGVISNQNIINLINNNANIPIKKIPPNNIINNNVNMPIKKINPNNIINNNQTHITMNSNLINNTLKVPLNNIIVNPNIIKNNIQNPNIIQNMKINPQITNGHAYPNNKINAINKINPINQINQTINQLNIPQKISLPNLNSLIPGRTLFPPQNVPISNILPPNMREPNEGINLTEFKVVKEIGQGTFGRIYKVIWLINNKIYALKKEVLKDIEGVKVRQHRNETIRNFIKRTNCKGIVNLYGNLTIPNGAEFHYYELMELCERDFEQEMKLRSINFNYYSEQELYNIMYQLIVTLAFLQKNHITHRDIKPQNILISNGIYKLCDFGDVRLMQREGIVVQRVRGSELYMSPILFNGLRTKQLQVRHNTYKSDVFSLGMCFLLAACLSYDGLVEIRELVDMNQKLFIINKHLSRRYSPKLIRIMGLMLETTESNRPDFIDLENALVN